MLSLIWLVLKFNEKVRDISGRSENTHRSNALLMLNQNLKRSRVWTLLHFDLIGQSKGGRISG
jgi:hypothetical protein